MKLGSEVVVLLTKPLVPPNFSVDSKYQFQYATPAHIKYSKCWWQRPSSTIALIINDQQVKSSTIQY